MKYNLKITHYSRFVSIGINEDTYTKHKMTIIHLRIVNNEKQKHKKINKILEYKLQINLHFHLISTSFRAIFKFLVFFTMNNLFVTKVMYNYVYTFTIWVAWIAIFLLFQLPFL